VTCWALGRYCPFALFFLRACDALGADQLCVIGFRCCNWGSTTSSIFRWPWKQSGAPQARRRRRWKSRKTANDISCLDCMQMARTGYRRAAKLRVRCHSPPKKGALRIAVAQNHPTILFGTDCTKRLCLSWIRNCYQAGFTQQRRQ
jgi:hypothetical protein